jgi:hypothetical protein
MGGGWHDGRGLRLMMRPTLQVGWMGLDARVGDVRPSERSWEAEDNDHSEEALAGDMECTGEDHVLEGGDMSRVDQRAGPRWEQRPQ